MNLFATDLFWNLLNFRHLEYSLWYARVIFPSGDHTSDEWSSDSDRHHQSPWARPDMWGTPASDVKGAGAGQWRGWADQSLCVICGVSCHNTWTPQQQHRANNRGSNNSTPHSDMKVRSNFCKLQNRESITSPEKVLTSLSVLRGVAVWFWCDFKLWWLLSIKVKTTILCTVRQVDMVCYWCNVNPGFLQDLVTIYLKNVFFLFLAPSGSQGMLMCVWPSCFRQASCSDH